METSRHEGGSVANIPIVADNASFEFVTGRIFVGEGVENAIASGGGKTVTRNDGPNNPGILPVHADLLIVQIAPQQLGNDQGSQPSAEKSLH
jgi:hypothetical protein